MLAAIIRLGAAEIGHRTIPRRHKRPACQYAVRRWFVAVLDHGQSSEKGFAANARHNARWVGWYLFFTTAPA